MKKKLIFLVSGLLIVLLFFNVVLTANAEASPAQEISVVIGGKKVVFIDQKPLIDKNNRTLVPIRFIGEELGASVYWDEAKQEVKIIFEGRTIELIINKEDVIISDGINTKIKNMGTKSILLNGRTMVPLRFISESFGVKVDWIGSTRTIIMHRDNLTMPDVELLARMNLIDKNKYDRFARMNGYVTHKHWNKDTDILFSDGSFTDYALPINIGDYKDNIVFDFAVKNEQNISWVSIYFSTSLDYSDYYFYDITADFANGANEVAVNRDQFQIGAGNPAWEDVKYFRIALQAKEETEVKVGLGTLASYVDEKALITLWFDDGWEDNYSNAHRIIKEVDPEIRGTISLVATLIGQERYLNISQLHELKAANWEFVNHTYTHPYLTELAEEEIISEIVNNYRFVSQFDARGAYHLAVPYSSIDERVLDIVKKYSLSARYVPEVQDDRLFDRYAIGFMEVKNDTDFNTVKAYIDEAIANKSWLNLLFHRIEDHTDDRYSYGTENFTMLVEYLSRKKDEVAVVTPSEVFELVLPMDKVYD